MSRSSLGLGVDVVLLEELHHVLWNPSLDVLWRNVERLEPLLELGHEFGIRPKLVVGPTQVILGHEVLPILSVFGSLLMQLLVLYLLIHVLHDLLHHFESLILVSLVDLKLLLLLFELILFLKDIGLQKFLLSGLTNKLSSNILL